MSELKSVGTGMFECYVCRDGEVNIDCEECGRKKKYGSGEVKEQMKASDYARLLVPEFYRGIEFKKEVLIETHPECKSQLDFNTYAENLQRVHDSIAQGKVPAKSGIFIAPKTFGKVTWAYSCLQMAELKGLTTFPIMSTQELNYFLTMQEEKPFSKTKIFGDEFGWTYQDFLEADIVFVTVPKNKFRQKAFEVIEDVLDKRSRFGRSTFIISAFGLSDITAYDRRGTSARLLDRSGKQNPQRYPLIIQYFDETNKPKYI